MTTKLPVTFNHFWMTTNLPATFNDFPDDDQSAGHFPKRPICHFRNDDQSAETTFEMTTNLPATFPDDDQSAGHFRNNDQSAVNFRNNDQPAETTFEMNDQSAFSPTSKSPQT